MYDLSHKPKLPHSDIILALGITSIVATFCNGVPGLIIGIIAIVLGNLRMKEYQADPSLYSQASYNNAKAGFITGIIGTALAAFFVIILFIFIGSIGVLAFLLDQ